MRKPISKESELRLMDALEKVAALTNDGVHPNEAITKIASEMQIPAGHVRLMVNATNTGRTNAQRLTSEDPFDKAAEFPLADASTILGELYPSEVQTKAAAFLQSYVADEYRQSPKWLKEKAAHEKAARAVSWKLTDSAPIVERDPEIEMKKAYVASQKLEQDVDAKRMEVMRHRQHAIKLAADLREYFQRPGHIPFSEIAENCELLLGKVANVVLRDAKPDKELYAKTASTPVSFDLEPYKLVKDVIAVASKFNESREAYTAAIKVANHEARKLLRPFGRGLMQGSSVLEDLYLQPDLNKEAFFGGVVSRGLGMMTAGEIAKEVARKMPFSPNLSPDMERRDLMNLMDPRHEAEIRNIQSEALLNDLLANDDVIKGYDPEEAVDAFNEVSQIAPHSVGTKAIMRDLMRKRLAGGAAALDQFTVGDTLGQQVKMRDLNSPQPAELGILQGLGGFPNGQHHHSQSVIGGK